MRLGRLLGAAVMWLVSSRIAEGQFAPGVTLQPVSDIRITLIDPESRLRGFFVSADSQSIRISRRNSATISVAFANVRSVALRGGRDRKRGAIIGASILGGIGLVFGGIDAARDEISGGDYVGTIVVNGLIGALVGAALAPTGWIEVPLARSR